MSLPKDAINKIGRAIVELAGHAGQGGLVLANQDGTPFDSVGASVALSAPAAALTAGADTTFTFASQVKHIVIQNNTTSDININLDAAATLGTILVKAGQLLSLEAPGTAVHILSAAASNVNGSTGANIVLLGWD